MPLVARHPGRRGTATLRRIVEDRHAIGRTVTRSELELAFLAFVDAHGLPRPQTYQRIDHRSGGHEADAVWPDARLVAKLDGYAIHATRRNFEADRARDRALLVEGWRMVRITWRKLEDRPDRLASALRRAARVKRRLSARLPADRRPGRVRAPTG